MLRPKAQTEADEQYEPVKFTSAKRKLERTASSWPARISAITPAEKNLLHERTGTAFVLFPSLTSYTACCFTLQ